MNFDEPGLNNSGENEKLDKLKGLLRSWTRFCSSLWIIRAKGTEKIVLYLLC